MIPKYADEAAYPQPHLMRLHESQKDAVVLPAQWGLTKREYFAAQALQAILASGDSSRVSFEEYATCAVHHADALLATLQRIPASQGEKA